MALINLFFNYLMNMIVDSISEEKITIHFTQNLADQRKYV